MLFQHLMPALLVTGALAHPRPKHLEDVLEERDTTYKTFQGDHWQVVDVVVQTVTVPNGEGRPTPVTQNKVVQNQGQFHPQGNSPSPSPSPTPAVNGNQNGRYQRPKNQQSSAPVVVQSEPTGTTPTPTETGTSTGTGSGDAQGTGPASGPNNIDTKGGSSWDANVNSMGKSILATANYWRNKHTPGSGNFKWSQKLSDNARITAQHAIIPATGCDSQGQNCKTDAQYEGGASDLGHFLNPGSNGQTENVGDGTTMNGDLTPFENAWLGWLCERANDRIPCNDIAEYKNGYKSTGHADIILGKYPTIGCYYQDATNKALKGYPGVWTCDFSFDENP